MIDRPLLVLALAALSAVILVRRARRSFGRQPFRPAGLAFVVGLMSVIATVVLVVSREPLGTALAGVAAGVALAGLALARTRFGTDADGRFYVPSGTIGLIVLVLFLVRVLARLAGRDGAGTTAAGGSAAPGMLLLLFLLLGYYVAYYGGVLVRGSRRP